MGNTPRRKSKAGTRTAPPSSRTRTATPSGGSNLSRYLIIGGAVLVVAILLGAVLFGGGEERPEISFAGVPEGVPEGVEEVEVVDRTHIDGDIDYGVAVPPGGIHNSVWLNCGYYDEPVRAENAVHLLEHGGVWITYRSDIGADDLAVLRDYGRQREFEIAVSEVPDQDSMVMATAWGAQLPLETFDDVALRQFIQAYENGPFAPEVSAGCGGGVGNPE